MRPFWAGLAVLVSRLSQKDKRFEQNCFNKSYWSINEEKDIKNVQTSSLKGISNEIIQCEF